MCCFSCRSPADKKARRCPHCDKIYVSMPAFSMHVRTHNQGCKCQYCGKCFSRPWLLQGHIRTHTGKSINRLIIDIPIPTLTAPTEFLNHLFFSQVKNLLSAPYATKPLQISQTYVPIYRHIQTRSLTCVDDVVKHSP